MANFKTFTNASAPYEGKKIAIDMDRIACFFEDVLKADEGKHTTIIKLPGRDRSCKCSNSKGVSDKEKLQLVCE